MSGEKDALSAAVGHEIRERRTAMRLSQEKLAEAAGLNQTSISLLERGEHSPTLTTLESLAEALETTLTALVACAEARVRRGRI